MDATTKSELDTDTLLAIVSSLLEDPIPDQHILLDALIQANGDVENAANSLRAIRSDTRNGKKRVLSGVLDGWLTPEISNQSRKKGKSATTSNPVVPAERTHSPPMKVPPAAAMSPSKVLDSAKPLVPLTDVLRSRPSAPSSAIPRLPPLTLSNPEMVEDHTPCTLHLGVLPPELACQLFHRMIDASKDWRPNKWWLFDRVVESPHKTSFYARKIDGVNSDESWQEAAQYWYNGRTTNPPPIFPPEMEEACQYVEKIVNKTMQHRHRYPLEWDGIGIGGQIWKANVAASNCYAGGKEGVGFHSDQLTYLGPFPTIASLSLGVTRVFRLREVVPKSRTDQRHAQTFNIPVVHNSLVIMHATTQERFKHSIPPQKAIDLFHPMSPHLNPDPDNASNCRINITFRFYRPDFRPKSIPKCRCDLPCILRADMKGRDDDKEAEMRYFWMCYAGAQNDGKGCTFVKVMDCKAEGRGPFIGDRELIPKPEQSSTTSIQ